MEDSEDVETESGQAKRVSVRSQRLRKLPRSEGSVLQEQKRTEGDQGGDSLLSLWSSGYAYFSFFRGRLFGALGKVAGSLLKPCRGLTGRSGRVLGRAMKTLGKELALGHRENFGKAIREWRRQGVRQTEGK